jgi:hypothetical protein
MRRQKSLRIDVHIANAVVWEPVYRTHLAAVADPPPPPTAPRDVLPLSYGISSGSFTKFTGRVLCNLRAVGREVERSGTVVRRKEGRKDPKTKPRGKKKEKKNRAPETSNEIVVRPRGGLRGVEVPRRPVRDAGVVDLRAPRPRRVRSRVPGSASRYPDESVRVLRKIVSTA